MKLRLILTLFAAALLQQGFGANDPVEQAAPLVPEYNTVLYKKAPDVPADMWSRQLKAASGDQNWSVYGGNLKAWRYSSLTQINKQNAKDLQVAWMLPTGMHDAFEASPIIIDGTMYFSTSWDHVYAVNAVTGEVYWHFVKNLPKSLPLCCGAVNRGVAVADGKVFLATLDGHVMALDAKTGQVAWDNHVANINEGYSYTAAPMVIKDKVIVGISGGDFGARGFIDAFDVKTGKQVWRFWCVPGPGEKGNETWKGDSWKHGGATAWMPVTFDSASNTIFAGLGNPGPDLDGSVREGDNLYSESTVALDPDTGKIKWHFQVLPHDVWDLDNVTETLIDDITIDGQKRQVVFLASKNGFFYVLDRHTGKCIYAMQYVHRVNWGKVDSDGTPHPDFSMSPVKDRFTVVYPGSSGGKEWCPVSYDPQMKRIFIPVIENGHRHKLMDQTFKGGLNYWAGISVPVPGEGYGHVCAIDVEKKQIAWDKLTKFTMVCGMACTASGLVISGTPDQKMQVRDSATGDILYEFKAASGWHSAPVVYEVNGVEYIAFANGWGGWTAGYDADGTPELDDLIKDNTMYVFALKDRIPKGNHPGPATQPTTAPQVPSMAKKMPGEGIE